jgi:CheY-like chemotaxis protein
MQRLLVAEDDDAIRQLIVTIVGESEFEIHEARDGRDAIERLEATSFDGLVLDVMMPRVDGIGVLKHLARSNPTLLSRTIVVTAYPEMLKPLGVLHACRTVRKPFAAADLRSAVDHCFLR